jgi:hypothetical protein
MARPEKITLEVPATPGSAGQAEHVFRFRDKTVQIVGEFTGSLQIEGKLADDEYAPIGSPVTAAGLFALPYTVEFLRIRTLTLSSGTPTAVFGGFDYRAL